MRFVVLLFLLPLVSGDFCSICKSNLHEMKTTLQKVSISSTMALVVLLAPKPPELGADLPQLIKFIMYLDPLLNEITCETIGVCNKDLDLFEAHYKVAISKEDLSDKEEDRMSCKQCQFYFANLNTKELAMSLCSTLDVSNASDCFSVMTWALTNKDTLRKLKDPKKTCNQLLQACNSIGMDTDHSSSNPQLVATQFTTSKIRLDTILFRQSSSPSNLTLAHHWPKSPAKNAEPGEPLKVE